MEEAVSSSQESEADEGGVGEEESEWKGCVAGKSVGHPEFRHWGGTGI